MIEPTREQEQTAERICEQRGGWAEVSPPATGRAVADGVVEVKVAGGDRYLVNDDGSYIDPENRLIRPEEE